MRVLAYESLWCHFLLCFCSRGGESHQPRACPFPGPTAGFGWPLTLGKGRVETRRPRVRAAAPQLAPAGARLVAVLPLRSRPLTQAASQLSATPGGCRSPNASAVLQGWNKSAPVLPGADRIAVVQPRNGILYLTWATRTGLLKPVHGAGPKAGRLPRRVYKSEVAGWDRCLGVAPVWGCWPR